MSNRFKAEEQLKLANQSGGAPAIYVYLVSAVVYALLFIAGAICDLDSTIANKGNQ